MDGGGGVIGTALIGSRDWQGISAYLAIKCTPLHILCDSSTM